jgi:hypothetical protein
LRPFVVIKVEKNNTVAVKKRVQNKAGIYRICDFSILLSTAHLLPAVYDEK